ncbi:deleted in malignant brain tumors 1 protein-like [Tiliqua scincoides]|uniref:deleted in malignant brain tumors 1 protein-like n=1 Tax=Tiliqua scincoides TaxID=71010 RepID=UPI0034625AE0
MAANIFPSLVRPRGRWLMAVILTLLACLWGATLESDPAIAIRLVNGSRKCSGRVEVFHNGQWGTICDNLWDIRDARVVCQEMGCGQARSAPRRAHFGRGVGPVWVDGLLCRGTELTLHDCRARNWGANNCSKEESAGVVCSGGTSESDSVFEIRLVNGPNSCSGRVEVSYNGQWGAACDDYWDIKDARVVCQQMGCGEARAAMGGAHFGRGSGPIWVDYVSCTGNEPTLHQCRWSFHWGASNCLNKEGAGVICSGASLESNISIGIRLVNGSSNCSGRVELLYNGQWGTVCDDDWDTRDARVVCQQMGCGEARAAPGGAHFGTGIGPIWLDGVRCSGTESALSQCPADQWGFHNCYHREDAGVVCSGASLESDTSIGIRLVNGSSNCSGRVEVFYSGQWGTICDDDWDTRDARVVCQQMGCREARAAPGGARFGMGTGLIWLDGVRCSGTESALSQCPADQWGVHNCRHGEDAGVICSGRTLELNTSTGIRLVNSRSNCSGRVEVFHDGQWGTVCDDDWDITDARIVCQEMGCGDARSAQSGGAFGHGTGPIWLDNIHCTGTESALSQCPAKRWESHNCHHGEDAGVICSGNQLNTSRLSLWAPALSVLLATALLAIGAIIWYLRSKWKGSRRYEVPLETTDITDGSDSQNVCWDLLGESRANFRWVPIHFNILFLIYST